MRKVDRRKFVSGIGAATLAGIAGCSGGGGGGGDDGGDSGGDTDTDTESGGGDGGDDAPDHVDPSTYPEFDPADPEFPQLTSTLLD